MRNCTVLCCDGRTGHLLQLHQTVYQKGQSWTVPQEVTLQWCVQCFGLDRVQKVFLWVSDRFKIPRSENFRINKIVQTSTIQRTADPLSLRTANLNTPNLMTAAANHSNNLSLFFNPILRQAVLTLCPLNLCMLQHTYRPGTAALLWRQVAGSGLSSSCGLQLALTATELVRSHNI